MTKTPHGADVVQEAPGEDIELMLWWSGDEPVYCTLSPKQALLLAQKLINLVVANDEC